MRFGDNLRNLRLQRGYTQQKLAKLMGTSQASITAWENETREPDFATIKRIAEFFHVPMSSLLPSNDAVSDEYTNKVANSLNQNPKLRLLFDRTEFLSDSDLDAVLSVVNAIARERDEFND